MLKNRSILINTPSVPFYKKSVLQELRIKKKKIGTINLFEMCLTITKLLMLVDYLWLCLISTLLLLQPYYDSSMHTC